MVLSIIAMLLSILLPVLGRARKAARRLLNTNNQKQVVNGVNLFSLDNDGWFPDSVAINSHFSSGNWNWHDPRKMVASYSFSANGHRSVSGNLKSYVDAEKLMFCPSSPGKHKYWELMWEMGDDYDCPTIAGPDDQFFGTYCLYWNYTGKVDESSTGKFSGPRRNTGGRNESKMLISDYLGYGHWNFEGVDVFGSCEKFKGASPTRETDYLSSSWSQKSNMPDIKLSAGFTDGSVRSYSSRDTVLMKVFRLSDLSATYGPGMGPGYFYIPEESLR